MHPALNLGVKWEKARHVPYPEPPRPKRRRWLLDLGLLLIVVILACLSMGCATKTTRLPDGTVIEESAPAIKQDTKRFVGDLVRAYSPRPIPPRVEREDAK